MKTKTTKRLLSVLPYTISLIIISALLILGSLKNPTTTGNVPILSLLDQTGYAPDTNQYDESFIVASLSSTLALPSAAAASEDYVSVLVAYKLGLLPTSPVLEKPNIIDTSNLSRGIITYAVQPGDSLDSIAARFGVSTTDIRWSNNLKTNNLAGKTTLYIPSRPGILYTVKSGDTFDSLAEKYQSNAEQIETFNDLENSGLKVGETIIIPGGSLPNTERPEYVAPRPRPTYISNVNSLTRQNLRRVGNDLSSSSCPNNPGSYGQCTWYAWCWRRARMGENYWLPTGRIGNAGTWTSSYNPARIPALFWIDHTPRYGDVVQTSTGSPGHVGVVTNVREGVDITIREMNYIGRNVVSEAEVPWAVAITYNYIHQRK